jgi:hypothetical protein
MESSAAEDVARPIGMSKGDSSRVGDAGLEEAHLVDDSLKSC